VELIAVVGASVGVCCRGKIEAAVCKCSKSGRSALVLGTKAGPKIGAEMEAISSSHPIDFTLKSAAVNNNNLDDSYIFQRHSSPGSSPNGSRSPSPTAPKSAPSGFNLLLGKPNSNSSAFRIVTPKGKNEGECHFIVLNLFLGLNLIFCSSLNSTRGFYVIFLEFFVFIITVLLAIL